MSQRFHLLLTSRQHALLGDESSEPVSQLPS